MRIGFVGTGTIAAAMVNGIVADGHEIFVSERNAVISAELATQHPNVTVADNQAVVDNSDIVILGLLAPAARVVLPELTFYSRQRVFSVIVGITFAELSAWVAPAQPGRAGVMLFCRAYAISRSPHSANHLLFSV